MIDDVLWVVAYFAPALLVSSALMLPVLVHLDETGRRRLLYGQSAVLLTTGVILAVYVASEDDYRNDGTSRWAAYDAHAASIAAVGSCLLVGGMALYFARRHTRWFGVPLVLGVIAMALLWLTLVSMTN